MATTSEAVRAEEQVDFMPLHGIDHLEMWVGNAAQASLLLPHAYGFSEVAYAGLETGSRDRVSHVLEQGGIRLVLTGTLRADTEIAEHHALHGDGIKVIALSVPDVDHAYREATSRGGNRFDRAARLDGRTRHACAWPTSPPTARPCHRFVDRSSYDGAVPPRLQARPRSRPTGAGSASTGIDHVVGNVELGEMNEWVEYYERRVRDDRDHPLHRRGDLDRVLGADVEGRHERRRPRSSSRSTSRPRPQAQVADRRVPRVLRGPGRRSTSR